MANLRLATRRRSDRDGGSPRDERNWLGRVRVLPPQRKVHGHPCCQPDGHLLCTSNLVFDVLLVDIVQW